ncbi:MAG: glycosyltransferase family 39 protein [Thermoanaerobaculia bacterium]|nr:glycosyltransferase family 39 protein [Thermoanaerobaculia bacterium]
MATAASVVLPAMVLPARSDESASRASQGFALPRWVALPSLGWPSALLICAFLGLAFQGSRGLWEPDEGFYANAAVAMVDSGDWWTPRLNGEPFLDKPPLNYWAMAISVTLLETLVEPNEWVLRLPHLFWFLGTALGVGLLADRLWGPGRGPTAALVYATMLCPLLAANALTPDTPLTFWVTLAVYGYWRWMEDVETRGSRWMLLLTAVVAAGLLTKGPAFLVFLFPLLLHSLVIHPRRAVWWLLPGTSGLIIAMSWYVSMALSLPDAAAYLLDNQVLGRLVESSYQRNPGWKGALLVYPVTLLVGTLPWGLGALWGLAGALRNRLRAMLRAPRENPGTLLLVLWLVAPLVVLTLASSRLPLYILPAFPAIAVAIGSAIARRQPPAHRVRRWVLVASWCVLLVTVKGFLANVETHRDARWVAQRLSAIGAKPGDEIVTVDEKLNGLAVYGFERVAHSRGWNRPYPFYSPPPSLDHELNRLDRSLVGSFWVVGDASRSEVLPERLAMLEDVVCLPQEMTPLLAFHCRRL